MAIDRDLQTRTAVSINYTRTGNTLNRRERHGVKDSTGVIIIISDETTSFVGKDALDYLANTISQRDNAQQYLDELIAGHNKQKDSIENEINFTTDQITEIQALLP